MREPTIRPSFTHLILLAAGVTLVTLDARALGPEPPAVLVKSFVEGKRSQARLLRETIDVGLQSDAVLDLQLSSRIEDANGQVVDSGEAGKSILARDPGNMSLHPDVVVARHGDVVRFARPLVRELPRGVYAEVTRLAVTDAGYSTSVIVSETRFYRVDAGGVQDISSAEFSEVVDGKPELMPDSQGNKTTVHTGKGFARGDAKALKEFRPLFDRDGNIANLDQAPEPAKADGVRDLSEVNER